MRGILALVAWIAGSGFAGAAPKIAVLEAIGPEGTPIAQAMGWTDAVRAAVLDAAPKDWIVLTRENLEAFLPPGVSLADCEGECEITTGRKVGAEYVVTARLSPIEAGWQITVALHATINGRFVGQGRRTVAPDDLDAGLAAAATLALQAVRAPAPSAAAGDDSIAIVPAEPMQWYGAPVLHVTSPHGATIYAIGKRQGRTPVRIPTGGATRMRIRAEAEGYRARTFEVELGPKGNTLAIELTRTAAELRLKVPLDGYAVAIDAVDAGRQRRYLVPAGRHVVEVTHPCMQPSRFEIDVTPGEVIERTVEPALTCGRLRFESPVDGAWVRWKGRHEKLPFITPPTTSEEVTVELGADGHTGVQRAVSAPLEGITVIAVELDPRWANLEVRAETWDGRPCRGPLSVDGEVVGPLPWSGRVLAGRRRLEAPCGDSTRRPASASLRLDVGARSVLLEEPERGGELLMRTDAGRTGQFLLRGWTHGRRAGRMRLGLGLAAGFLAAEEKTVPLFGLDVAAAVGVTRWLELAIGGTIGGGGEDCADPEEADCGYGYVSAQADLRLHTGRVVTELGWTATSASSRYAIDRDRHGPHISLGLEF